MTRTALLVFLLMVLEAAHAVPPPAIRVRQLDNWFAYIPANCYVDTRGVDGKLHNPCYTCHQQGIPPNYIDDSDLQLNYSFPGPALDNPWTNLFVDRTADVAEISDADVTSYVQSSNYLGDEGQLILAAKLSGKLPPNWDSNGNGRWEGFLPDLNYKLDNAGFDHTADGSYSGWRAYAYASFPGSFWPANGGGGDAFIRLKPVLRQNSQGEFDLEVYEANLAIVEAWVNQVSISGVSIDEKRFGIDFDRDGSLGIATRVEAVTDPLELPLVGMAAAEQSAGRLHLAPGLFPEGTEFLHSVRYLSTGAAGGVSLAPRMKELRYAIKGRWYFPHQLARFVSRENKEKVYTPDMPKWVRGNQEFGVSNRMGWRYQAFIEDRQGQLRPQTHQELAFCVGCHGGVGATTDSNFSFPRKFATYQGYMVAGGAGSQLYPGYTGSSAKDVEALLLTEIQRYFEANGAGDDYRTNQELADRYKHLQSHNSLSGTNAGALLAHLIWPSPRRALDLNKAYWLIVQQQGFARGRDPSITSVETVLREVEEGSTTGIAEPLSESPLFMRKAASDDIR